MLRETADLRFGNAQHLGHVRHGAAGLEGRKPAHHGAMLRSVFFKQQIDHLILAVVGEIHVDVGQFVERHAFLVQETTEVEAETDGAHVGNAQAVTDQAVSGAAAGDPFNAAPVTDLQQIPGDQEQILVSDLGDDGQFGFHLRPHLFQRNHRAGIG